MTPEQWARLAPPQQWQHMARFGPPPPGWPVPAPSMPYLVPPAPAVNVTVGQSSARELRCPSDSEAMTPRIPTPLVGLNPRRGGHRVGLGGRYAGFARPPPRWRG